MPVVPAEAGWIIKHCAPDATSASLRGATVALRRVLPQVVLRLDERCQIVCGLLSQGLSKSQIAERMQCGWHTVDRLVRTIRKRLEEAEVDAWLR